MHHNSQEQTAYLVMVQDGPESKLDTAWTVPGLAETRRENLKRMGKTATIFPVLLDPLKALNLAVQWA
jgi:hypothetical protein